MEAMSTIAAFAETAALAGDPARANMLMALMDGRALTASELAQAAGVTPQTASGHLGRLVAAGLLAVHRQGRHHYHRLASPAVANMVEGIMQVSIANGAAAGRRPVFTGPRDGAMRAARTCYKHLAGRLGVALADTLAERGHVALTPEGGAVTEAGKRFLAELGVELGGEKGGAVFCRPCLDWSERRLHIGGAVGEALAERCFALRWIERKPGSRAVAVTRAGERGFRETFGIPAGIPAVAA
jgi:DNA-binding transcriptional ArsR family regulator